MAMSLRNVIILLPYFQQNCSIATHVMLRTRISQSSAFLTRVGYRVSYLYKHQYASLRGLCVDIESRKMQWGASSQSIMHKKLELALDSHDLEGAWEVYGAFQRVYGIPERCLMNKLMIKLLYSSESKWLQKACDLVFVAVKQKSDFFQRDLLAKLILSLARAQLPIPTSMILRLMLEKESLPPVNILGLVMLHLVKTEIGTCVASNILIEICSCIKSSTSTRTSCMKLTKPDTLIFNLVLDACVRFESSFKGQEIIELMPLVGIVADADSINIIARIHEMNGQKDELNKFKEYIDQVSAPWLHHYQQFYDSLLSLHFKFNDIEAASGLVLGMYQSQNTVPVCKEGRGSKKPCLVPIGSKNLKEGLKLQIQPQLWQKDFVFQVKNRHSLVICKDGKLALSNQGLSKLIMQYKRHGRISDLPRLLVCVQKKLGLLKKCNLCPLVIDACIELGWLETAHDILEDMVLEGITALESSCVSLLLAYYKVKKFREAEALQKHIIRAGLDVCTLEGMLAFKHDLNVKDECLLSKNGCTLSKKSDLAKFLVQEMGEKEKVQSSTVYNFNSSIYFFMKAKMVGDAIRTYRRMQEKKMCPNVATFVNLVNGYSSLGRYREITFIWGDIKRAVKNGTLVVNRDLYESLLLNFLLGGYFERVLEVINCMKNNGMYVDKGMYRSQFLKLHKDLYRHLKAANTKTEAQHKRLEHVRMLRKWLGIG